MALGDPITYRPRGKDGVVAVSSLTSDWQTVLDAQAIDDADNGGNHITNPDTEIDGADHHDLNIEEPAGTHILVRMVYDDGVTSVTSPVIQVFGRTNDGSTTGRWMELENGTGDVSVTLTVDTTNDASDGELNYTRVRANTHFFDRRGCNRIRFGVKTAFAATGTVTTAFVQAKVI